MIRDLARWNGRRIERTARMNRDGSTAVTEAPRRAAWTVAGPMPAPMSTARSPSPGAARASASRFTSDCQNFRILNNQWNFVRNRLSWAWR